MEMETTDLLLIVGLFLIIAVGIVVIIFFKGEGTSCVKNPIQFYEQVQNTTCWCTNNLIPKR
jgi:hypothetical protein